MNTIIAIIVWFVIASIYFYPTLKAIQERRNNLFLIMAINGAFGWSIIGWIIAYLIARKSGIKEGPTITERIQSFNEKMDDINKNGTLDKNGNKVSFDTDIRDIFFKRK